MKRFGVEKFKGLLVSGSCAGLVEYLMGLSDSIVAGHLLGEEALVGINLLSPVMTTVTFFAGLIGVGTGINYSYESGRCDTRRAREFFTQGLLTACGIGLVLFLALLFGRGAFLSFMSPSARIASEAAAYWRWYVPSGLLEPLVVFTVNAVMTDGDTRLCFSCYIVQLAVNVSVSLLAVGPMGIAGCSFGTFVANVVALGLLSTHYLRRSNTYALVRHFSVRDTLTIMKSSFGDSSTFLCSAALFFFLNKYVLVNYGDGQMPVLAAVIALIGFLEVFNGVSNALSPVVTVYAGERNVRAIRTMMAVADRWAFGEGVALTLVVAVFPGLVVSLVGIDEPELRVAAASAVRWVSLGLVCYSAVYLYNSYYIFVGHEGMAVALTVLNSLVMPVALVSLLGRFGPGWTWASLAFAPLVAMAIFATWLTFRYGLSKFPLLLDRSRERRIAMFDLVLEENAIVDVSRRVANVIHAFGGSPSAAMRASLMTEEVFMAIRDRNGSRKVLAEATVDANDGIVLTLRDDGEIFDITDADQKISSLRTFLVASVMERQKSRRNLVTTGFNRNVFRF